MLNLRTEDTAIRRQLAFRVSRFGVIILCVLFPAFITIDDILSARTGPPYLRDLLLKNNSALFAMSSGALVLFYSFPRFVRHHIFAVQTIIFSCLLSSQLYIISRTRGELYILLSILTGFSVMTMYPGIFHFILMFFFILSSVVVLLLSGYSLPVLLTSHLALLGVTFVILYFKHHMIKSRLDVSRNNRRLAVFNTRMLKNSAALKPGMFSLSDLKGQKRISERLHDAFIASLETLTSTRSHDEAESRLEEVHDLLSKYSRLGQGEQGEEQRFHLLNVVAMLKETMRTSRPECRFQADLEEGLPLCLNGPSASLLSALTEILLRISEEKSSLVMQVSPGNILNSEKISIHFSFSSDSSLGLFLDYNRSSAEQVQSEVRALESASFALSALGWLSCGGRIELNQAEGSLELSMNLSPWDSEVVDSHLVSKGPRDLTACIYSRSASARLMYRLMLESLNFHVVVLNNRADFTDLADEPPGLFLFDLVYDEDRDILDEQLEHFSTSAWLAVTSKEGLLPVDELLRRPFSRLELKLRIDRLFSSRKMLNPEEYLPGRFPSQKIR